jgi:hypothetical protein
MGQDERRMNELRLDLLRSVLPNPRWDTSAYLDWVYDHNPVGGLVPIDVVEDGRVLCHIGGVPVLLRSEDIEGWFLILLNSSTAADAQGRGLYVQALFDVFEECGKMGGVGGYGVTNARSTGPATKGLRATPTGSLPARLVLPTALPSRRVRTFDCTPEFLASDEFSALTADLDDYAAKGFVTRWTTDILRWRLAFPYTSYKLHVSEELVGITTRATVKGVPVTVLMKFLPRAARRGPLDPWRMIATACLRHRTPVAVYAGYNANVPVPGIRIDQERLPAPLNLLVMSTSPGLHNDDFRFETFEFLDFDAY